MNKNVPEPHVTAAARALIAVRWAKTPPEERSAIARKTALARSPELARRVALIASLAARAKATSRQSPPPAPADANDIAALLEQQAKKQP